MKDELGSLTARLNKDALVSGDTSVSLVRRQQGEQAVARVGVVF